MLAKFTIPMIASCSTLRIDPYLSYIEKFTTQFSTTEKNDRSPCSFSRKWRFTSMARSSHKKSIGQPPWTAWKCANLSLTHNLTNPQVYRNITVLSHLKPLPQSLKPFICVLIGKTALHWAASVNSLEVTKELVRNGAKKDAQGKKVSWDKTL